MSLRLKDVVKEYPDFKLKIDLRVNKGELVTILGPSGCGKTTTLRVIAGFITPDKGNILVSDRPIDKLPPHKRQIGIVFQNYALFPNLNVLDNIAFGLKMQGVRRILREAKARKLLKLVHLQDYGGRKISQLSGGEQQRVALARALAVEPRLLLLDEPLSALDAKLRKGLRSEIRRIQRELAITTLYITHDQEEALALSDRIAVMRDGRIEQAGRPQEIYNEPANLFVAGFVGQANILKGTVRSIERGYALFNTALGDMRAPAPGGCYPGREMHLFFRPDVQLRAVLPLKTKATIYRVWLPAVNIWGRLYSLRLFRGIAALYCGCGVARRLLPVTRWSFLLRLIAAACCRPPGEP